MSRPRLRIRRKLIVVALIAVLLLLLELNRFLPGGWPGGGGEGGFRRSDVLGLEGDASTADETRLGPQENTIETLVQALDKDALLIQVFDAQGNEIFAEAQLIKHGRQLAMIEVEIRDEPDRLCAKGRALYSFRVGT